MARYGGEYRGGRRGGGRWRVREPAYGREYGRVRGYGGRRRAFRPTYREALGYYGEEPGYGEEFDYGEELGYGEEPGYAEGFGYGTEAGYGAGWGYGREEFPYAEAYDYEFGGRGWPYRERYRGRRRRPGEYRGRGYGAEYQYDWEMRRPEAFGMGYGYEYIRAGAPGYRRARGRMPRYRGMERRGWEPGARRRAPLGYEGEFTGRAYRGRAYRGRTVERGYERGYEPGPMERADYDIEMTSRAGMLSGHTPPDRWPDVGHDVDMRPARERQMSDDEIREAVLENLFQDTWIDPERIDIDVDQGVITLRGEVRDFMEARYAWDDAWESAGVRGVVNHLTVRADRPQEEMELPQTAGARKIPPQERRERPKPQRARRKRTEHRS